MSRQKAFEQLAPIAHKIARRYRSKIPPHVGTDDLVNVALVGVWEAVTRRYSHGLQAMTALAHIRAQGSIIDYLRARDWSSRRARKAGEAVTIVYFDDFKVDLDNPNLGQSVLHSFVTPEDELIDSQDKGRRAAVLEGALNTLSARDQYIMRKLLAGTAQVEVARELNVSAPRISQVFYRSLPRLKAYVKRALSHRKL